MHRTPLALAALFIFTAPLRAQQGIPVHGQVTGPQGRPLAGVRVELHLLLSDYQLYVRRLHGDGSASPAAATFSDAHGEYRLLAPASGLWQVEVRGRGFIPMRHVFGPLFEESLLPPVQLLEDGGVRVQVFDEAGQPMAGAGVLALPSDPMWRGIRKGGWLAAERRLFTASDGRAALPRAAGEILSYYVFKPGYLQTYFKSDASAVQAALSPGKAALAQVVDGQGRPVAGALLRTKQWHQGVTAKDGFIQLAVQDPSSQPGRAFLARWSPPSGSLFVFGRIGGHPGGPSQTAASSSPACLAGSATRSGSAPMVGRPGSAKSLPGTAPLNRKSF